MKRRVLVVVLVLAAALAVAVVFLSVYLRDRCRDERPPTEVAHRKLYWFIPDGMRADPELFNIYRWAEEGRLPNIRRMMHKGTYGFCKPAFPSHTPSSFATLLTGSYPEVHGVNDGPMHTAGNPLDRVSVGGFSSAAKKVEPIWVTLEKQADTAITLLSIPGSTPPELQKGITVRGRWGGWGADFHAVNFLTNEDRATGETRGRRARLFFSGPPLAQDVGIGAAAGWQGVPRSYSPAKQADLSAWGTTVHAYVYDSTDNGQTDYDGVVLSSDKQCVLATLRQRQWSDWLPITLNWKLPNSGLSRDVDTTVRIKLIRLENDGEFRIRFFYGNLNRHLTDPADVADELTAGVGPMVDFVDNFPPQLIYCPQDKATFLEEAGMSLDWHRDAVGFIVKRYGPQVFIHDTYTPNQMLTSRWWMGYVDPSSARYGDASDKERVKLWEEVHWMYKKLDDIVGALLDNADDDTVVVLSSDHGIVPLDRSVRLNNLFAREGLLRFTIDRATGEPVVDWDHTQAVYLQMDNIYVNPAGLGGNWQRASGPEYERLRQRVKHLLLDLADEKGVKPLAKIVEWERVRREFRLLEERAGDLIIANRPGYGWSEEMTADLKVFSVPLESGYKQAVIADEVKGMWTPFMVIGPGVREGHYLGDQPVEIVDQYPTIMRLLGRETPAFVQGAAIEGVFSPEY